MHIMSNFALPATTTREFVFDLEPATRFAIDDEGVVRLRVRRYPTIASLRGAAGHLNKPLSWQEIQKIAQEDRFITQFESK